MPRTTMTTPFCVPDRTPARPPAPAAAPLDRRVVSRGPGSRLGDDLGAQLDAFVADRDVRRGAGDDRYDLIAPLPAERAANRLEESRGIGAWLVHYASRQ